MPVTTYCTRGEFRAYALPMGQADTSDDVVIDGIIAAVSRFIDSQTGRYFYTGATDETRYYTAEFADKIFTDDIVAVTTLATDGSGDRTYGDLWSATADYDLVPYNAPDDGLPYTGIETSVLGAYTFPSYRKGVKIVGTFGFPSVPSDIHEACLDIARNVYHRRFGQANEGQATITAAGVIITPRDLSDFAKSTLARYRRKV